MFRRQLQIRLVKLTDEPETKTADSSLLSIVDIENVVQKIFVGIGALIFVNAFSKILVNKLS